jgi:tetratricopeptide (TPR) repeat protein
LTVLGRQCSKAARRPFASLKLEGDEMPKWSRRGRAADARREADALNDTGVSLMTSGRFQEARTACEQAAEIFRRIGDVHDEAVALSNAGMALYDMAAFEEAVRVHARAIGLIVRSWDLGSQAKIRFRLGIALAKVGRLAEALTEQDLAADAFHEAAQADNEALALAEKADMLLLLGRFRDAIPAFEASLRLTGDGNLPLAGALPAKGLVEHHLGAALYSADRYRDAIAAQERAVALFREAGDRAGEANAQDSLGQALGGAGRIDEAITAYRAAAVIFREAQDPRGEGTAMSNLGAALAAARQFDDAIAAHEQAIALLRRAGEELVAGAALTDLGVALRGARRFDEAISAHESAAAIARKAGHRDLEATAAHDLEDTRAARDGTAQDDPRDRLDPAHLAGDALNDRGLSLQRSGSFEEAETAFREAAAIFERLGDRRDESAALCNVGICLRKRGLHSQAIDVLDQALTPAGDGTGDQDLTGRIVQELGGALTDHGIALVEQRRFPDAIATHERAAGLLREHGDRHGEGCALNNLSVALYGSQRFAEAASACEQAVPIFRDTKDRAREGLALDGQGRALAMLHRLDDAITAHQAAAACFRNVHDSRGEGETLTYLGAAQHLCGRCEEADATFQRTIAILQLAGDRDKMAMAEQLLAECRARRNG